MTSKQLLAVPEAAAYLGITKQAIYQLTKQGLGTRTGNRWVFTTTELDGWRDRPQINAGRGAGRNARDIAVTRPEMDGTGQPVTVSQRRPNAAKLPTTVKIDGTLHWAADATTTICGKHWSPAQIVSPSTNVCPRCRGEASKRGIPTTGAS